MDTAPRIYPDKPLSDIPDDARGVCLRITAEDLRGPRVGRCVDELMHLSEHPERIRQLRCGLILDIDGLDGDGRAPHDIPACRRFFQALHRQWPYWMHFLAPLPAQWRTLALSLLTPDTPEGGPHAPAIAAEALEDLVRSLVAGMDRLHRQSDLDGTERSAVMVASLRALALALPAQPPR